MRDGDESFLRLQGSVKEKSQEAYAYTNFVMNYVQWVLATGLGYYVLSKYNESFATNITTVMLTTLLYPIFTNIAASIMHLAGFRSYIATQSGVLMLSLVCAYFAAEPFAEVVRFIAKSQGCS